MTILDEINIIVEEIFDCDKRNIENVNGILVRINNLLQKQKTVSKKAYLVSLSPESPTKDEERANAELKDCLSHKGLALLQKHATPFLISLMGRIPKGVADESEFLDRVSDLTSKLCGRIDCGETTSDFEFPNAGSISLRETSFTEAEIGFQTWGAGILLAKMIDEGKIQVADQNVLELGSGTGITGLVAGRMGSRKVFMTDYHPVVIENAKINIDRNYLSGNVQCLKLDWRCCLEDDTLLYNDQDESLSTTDFKLIIAADCIFDLMHANLVPKVAKKYLSKDPSSRFHVLLPHRLQFAKEIAAFEANMPKEGWILKDSFWIEKHALTFRYYLFHCNLSRKKE